MNIVFTCGGTAGHINPAIALAQLFRERQPDCRILFIGGKGGMEEDLLPRAGFELKTVKVSNFQRKISFSNLIHNLKALYYLVSSAVKVRKILRDFHADVVVGMGGYASYPAMRQGARMGIPVLVHEANAMPGLTTRMIAPHADKIMVAFEESRKFYRDPEEVAVVGMPVQEAFLRASKEEMKAKLGLTGKKVVLSAWGSLGARDMNRQMEEFIRLESENPQFYHIHSTGKDAAQWMPEEIRAEGVKLEEHPELDIRPYIYNMTELMVAADLMLSRAGASSLNEIAASGTPAIIVPSPNVTANHQEKNARILGDRGAAVVIRESECSGKLLYETAVQILNDPARMESMSRAAKSAAVPDSADRIYQYIMDAVKGHVNDN